MSNSTTRRRGRHAAAPPPRPAPVVSPTPTRWLPFPKDATHLPGMELLGFYDEPYQVAVERPRIEPREAPFVPSRRRPSTAALTPAARVSALWETTDLSESALDWWKPQAIGRRRLGGRRVRLSTLVAVSAGLVGLLLLVWSAVQRPERLAQQSLETLGADTAALVETLGPVEEVVRRLGSPEAPDLAQTTQAMLDAEAAARKLFSDASAHSDQRRDSTVAAAGSVLEATSRANRLLAYRLTAERTLSPPALPTSPADTDLPSATEAVAAWRAQTETEVGDLAPDVLPDHHTAVEDWLASLDRWQARYLDAVRQEDGRAMARGVTDLEAQVSALHQTLLDELAEAGGELRSVIADARREAEKLVGG